LDQNKNWAFPSAGRNNVAIIGGFENAGFLKADKTGEAELRWKLMRCGSDAH
jgi:hypothetical protein